MTKLFSTFIFLCLLSISLNAQVGINTASPNASAALDVTSTTQGMLVPRMTAAQRTAIASPANGLLVYQTDATAGFYFYNGTAWASLSGGGSGDNLGNHTATQNLNMANQDITSVDNMQVNSFTYTKAPVYTFTSSNVVNYTNGGNNALVYSFDYPNILTTNNATIIRFDCAKNFSLCGLPGGVDGRTVYLSNIGTTNMVLLASPPTSGGNEPLGNRFVSTNGGNTTLTGFGYVKLMYDSSLNSGNGGWMVMDSGL